jgi:hypothetical protein
MIRKWSYITFNNINVIFKFSNIHTYTYMYTRYKFKIFRMYTRFKNYKIKLTYFIRKTPLVRKRWSVWNIYNSIINTWVVLYIKYKKIFLFSQGYNMCPISLSFTFFNNTFFKGLSRTELPQLINTLGLNTVSLQNSLQKYFVQRTPSNMLPKEHPTYNYWDLIYLSITPHTLVESSLFNSNIINNLLYYRNKRLPIMSNSLEFYNKNVICYTKLCLLKTLININTAWKKFLYS